MQTYAHYQEKGTFEARPMTKAEGLALQGGRHAEFVSKAGDIRRCKINGAVKTWKRDANRIEIPVKYGMYECGRFSWDETSQCYVATNGVFLCVRSTQSL